MKKYSSKQAKKGKLAYRTPSQFIYELLYPKGMECPLRGKFFRRQEHPILRNKNKAAKIKNAGKQQKPR